MICAFLLAALLAQSDISSGPINVGTTLSQLAGSTSVTATGSTAPRSLADRFADAVNAKNHGAVGDGVADDTVAIQAAVAAGCSNAKGVYIPGGNYIISSTVTACGGVRVFGDGDASRLLPTISDASPVLNFPAGSTFFRVDNIRIASSLNSATFLAGGAAQQTIGIRIQSSGTNSARFSLHNVHTYGLKTGFDITGFIITADNLWAEYNEVGFKLASGNSVDLNLRLENNRQDYAITSSAAVLLRQLIAEGSNTVPVASTIDSSNGVTLLAPYMEGSPSAPRAVPYLTVGGTSAVTQFKIVGGNIVGSSSFTTGTYPISLDQVTGADINAHFSVGAQLRKVLTTANTKDYRFTGDDSSTGWMTDESKQIGPALNYWPNRQFDMWLKGYKAILSTRSTFAQETTTVRKGANAFKVLATAGQNQNHTDIQIDGPGITALRGKTVRLGAWIFVPNITEYDESNRTALPDIIAESWNGSAAVQSATQNTKAARNAWNFFTAEVTMQSDATRFDAWFIPNHSGTNASGNEYLIIGTVTLVESSVPVSRQMNDDVPDSPFVRAIGVNGQLVMFDSAKPSDANQTYAVADTVFNTAPAVGGPQGWVCTTGGSPGTWVTFGPVWIGAATLTAGSATVSVSSGCRAMCTDTTNANAIKCSVSGTTLTMTGTGSDVINWFCLN